MPSSYQNWMAEIKKRADARNSENAAYDTARAGELSAYEADRTADQSAYNQWDVGRQRAMGFFNQDQNNQRVRYEADRQRARKAIMDPRGADYYRPLRKDPQAFAMADKMRYQKELAAFNQQWQGFQPGQFEYEAAPEMSPLSVRDPRAAEAISTYKPGQGNAGSFRGSPTAQYGADFLDTYGRNVLGLNPQMTPLQRMMDLTDKQYGQGDLSTGTQAARDYFAKSLTDWLRQQRGGSGDFSALDESMDLQKMIKERLGLSYSNPDDLWAAVNKNYGYVNQPTAVAAPTQGVRPDVGPGGVWGPPARVPAPQAGVRPDVGPGGMWWQPAKQTPAPLAGVRPDVGPGGVWGSPIKQDPNPVYPDRPKGTKVMVNGRPIWRPS